MTSGDWLPPQAPGGRPPPRFEPSVGEPEVPQPPAEPAAPAAPVFVPSRPKPAGGTNALAITALILGIAGLALLLLSLGLGFIITLPCSIAAWICGAQARTRIDLGEAQGGRGQAQAGYVLGIIGVVLGVAAMIGWIAAFAAGLDLDQLQRDLEQWRDDLERRSRS